MGRVLAVGQPANWPAGWLFARLQKVGHCHHISSGFYTCVPHSWATPRLHTQCKACGDSAKGRATRACARSAFVLCFSCQVGCSSCCKAVWTARQDTEAGSPVVCVVFVFPAKVHNICKASGVVGICRGNVAHSAAGVGETRSVNCRGLGSRLVVCWIIARCHY